MTSKKSESPKIHLQEIINKSSMKSINYKVEVPVFLRIMTKFETKSFSNDNPLLARENAFSYLSEIIQFAFREKIIRIFDFKDETSSELVELTDLSNFKTKENDLDFHRLLQCKITYFYHEDLKDDTHSIRLQRNGGLIQETALKIMLNDVQLPAREIFAFQNLEKTSQATLERRTLIMHYQNSTTQHDFPANKIPTDLFLVKEKSRKCQEIFRQKDNLREKEIITEDYFIHFEKIYLSFLNTSGSKYLFILTENNQAWLHILDLLQAMYRHQSHLKFYSEITIDSKKYLVFNHHQPFVEKLILSREGKIFIRNHEGCVEIDEKTRIGEIVAKDRVKSKIQNLLENL